MEIVRISSSPSTKTFDVDANYNGSIPAALAAVAKAALPAATTAEVVLGAKAYLITEHLAVPAGTSITGAGATNTTLTFSLHPPQRGEPGAAFEMVRAQSPASQLQPARKIAVQSTTATHCMLCRRQTRR